MKIIDHLFNLEEINGGICPTYLYRWTLLKTKWFNIYIHHFVGGDWSRDLHDHPKRFISFGLKGGYTEITPSGSKEFKAPWIRSFPASHIHRLEATNCWTVVITLKAVRKWGFWCNGEWINWRTYVGSINAWRAKNCPD